MTTKSKDLQGDAPERQAPPSGPAQKPLSTNRTQAASARSTSQLKALTELDEPNFEPMRASELFSPPQFSKPALPMPPTAANQNAQTTRTSAQHVALQETEADLARAAGRASAVAQPAVEPEVATRVQTHVTPEAWFDTKLAALAPLDPRQQLAWRFEAAFAAHQLLLPTAPTAEAREVMTNVLRNYEKRLRTAAQSPQGGAAPSTEALHAYLSERQLAELDPCMSEFEVALLTLDECVPDDQFAKSFSKQHVAPKQLLQYARFLASRGFGVGYERDRFEALTQELLTTKLPSGKLLLTSRKRAAPVLLRLVRGLPRPPDSAQTLTTQLSYLCDSLDRLQSLTRPKQFFDSGFYADVYGYKLSEHAHIVSPEFLYLCVAMNVEIHNRLLAFSESASDAGKKDGVSAATLQAQLQAQHEAVRDVFPDFHRPLVGARATRPAKKARRKGAQWTIPYSHVLRVAAIALLPLLAIAANLYVLGAVQLESPPEVLSEARLQALSPLLVSGRLTPSGKHFEGLLARPAWARLTSRQRQDAAEQLARALKAQGIEHAAVLAYKTRAIEVDFGSVVFVDESH